MTGFAEDLPTNLLEIGGMDDIGKALFTAWRLRSGEFGIPAELLRLSPYLILTAGNAPAGDSPEILRVGEKTLFSSLVPEAADSEAVRPKTLLDDNFRSTAHVGYHCAIEEGLSYQILSERCYPHNIPTDILYERVIVRWPLKSGLSQLTTYVKPLEIRRQISQANPWHAPACSQPSQGRYQSMRVPFANGFRPGERSRIHKPGDSVYSTR